MSIDWRELGRSYWEDIHDWSEGRFWIPRALLIPIMAYIGIRHLGDPLYTSIVGGINLGIHEMGHVLFSWGPKFLMILGGTLLQLAAPAIAIVVFLRQRDYYGIGFCGFWMGTNLYNVAGYVSDARAMVLPLVGIGSGEPEHDWHYMLSKLHLLNFDTTLGFLIRVAAFLSIWGGIAFCCWLLWLMARSGRSRIGESG